MEYFVPGKGKACENCAFRKPDSSCKKAIRDRQSGILTSPRIESGVCKTFQPNNLAAVARGVVKGFLQTLHPF